MTRGVPKWVMTGVVASTLLVTGCQGSAGPAAGGAW